MNKLFCLTCAIKSFEKLCIKYITFCSSLRKRQIWYIELPSEENGDNFGFFFPCLVNNRFHFRKMAEFSPEYSKCLIASSVGFPTDEHSEIRTNGVGFKWFCFNNVLISQFELVNKNCKIYSERKCVSRFELVFHSLQQSLEHHVVWQYSFD